MKRALSLSLVASLLVFGCTETANPDAGHLSVTPRGDGSAGTTTPADGSGGSSSSSGGKEGGAGSAGTTGAGGSTDAAGSTGTAGTTGAGGKGGEAGGKGGEGGSKGGAGGGNGGAGGNGGVSTGGVSGAGGTGGVATSFIHATDPFPGITAGDLVNLLIKPSGEIYVARLAGLAVSTNKGDSWTVISSTLPSPIVGALGLNSLGEVVAGVGRGTVNYGAYRLSGGTWTKCLNITAHDAVSSFVLDKTGALVAATSSDAGIWRSTDDGASFTNVTLHVTAATGNIGNLTKDPSNGDLYTGGELDALYKSTDNGSTWTAAGLADAEGYKGNILAILFNRLGELLVSRNMTNGSSGLQRRTTGGVWTTSSNGIPAYSIVRDVQLNKTTGTVYATSASSNGASGGVFISRDDGATWNAFSTGLPGTPVMKVAIGPDGTLYAVHKDGTFYRTNGAVP
jgi:hypothetical protein